MPSSPAEHEAHAQPANDAHRTTDPKDDTASFPAPPWDDSAEDSDRGKAGLLWWLLGLLALIALLAQGAYHSRQLWLADPLIRQALAPLAAHFNYELPRVTDADKLVLSQRKIMTHPSAENAILVQAVLRNEAKIAQPLPGLRLRFLGSEGEVIAQRLFLPKEYLPNPPPKILEPETRLTLRLELDRPPLEQLSFELDFEPLPWEPVGFGRF